MAVPYMLLQDSLNVMLKGKMYNVRKSTPEYDQVKELIKSDGSEEEILSIVDKPVTIVKKSHGNLIVENGDVLYRGRKAEGPIVSRILYMVEEGIDLAPIEKFLDNLDLNPSSRSVNELYSFLEQCELPITEDGYFLAYKKVGKDYLSIHSDTDGTRLDNHVGFTVSMPRNKVDDNFNNGCGAGLHVASKKYFDQSGYGNGERLLVVKVNPKDVVSVPIECNFTKMRVCEYEVIMEVERDDKYDIPDNYVDTSDYLDEEEEEEVDKKDLFGKVWGVVDKYLLDKHEVHFELDDYLSDHLTSLQVYNVLRHFSAFYDLSDSCFRDWNVNYSDGTFRMLIDCVVEESTK